MLDKILKVQILLVLTLTAILMSLVLPAYAQSPGIPQEFRGNVTVNGSPPPQGSTVSVAIGSIQVAASTTDVQGRYGYASPLLVSSTSGSLLEFYVNGVKAKETATFKSGEMTTLNLTVSSGSPPPSQPSPSTPSAVPPSVASFIVSNLNVSQSSLKPGELVTITADVKNGGGNEGTYKIVLKVNDSTEIEQTITLGAGKSQKLIYTISKERPGNYSLAIDSQNKTFSVSTPESSWITSITNQPWWIYTIAGIGVLLVILIVILLMSRRNASYF